MVRADNQQPQEQQQVPQNLDGTSGQALHAQIPSTVPSAASDPHSQGSTTYSRDTSAQNQAQNRPPLNAFQSPAPPPAPRRDSLDPMAGTRAVSAGRVPSVAELQDLGRRWFAFESARASYVANPGDWHTAPLEGHYFGPDQRRWLRQMSYTANPSPAQVQRNILLRNVVWQLRETRQPQPSHPAAPPAASAQAPQAPQPSPAPQAYQVPHAPQAPRPSNSMLPAQHHPHELIWDASPPYAAMPPNRTASEIVVGPPPVLIFPQPSQYQDLSINQCRGTDRAGLDPPARSGTRTLLPRQTLVQTATTDEYVSMSRIRMRPPPGNGMTSPTQHSPNGGMYRTAANQSALVVNHPGRTATQQQPQHGIHQPVPRPIPNPSPMLHSAIGPSSPPRHAEYWTETGSLLLPGGDPRFMDLSWMAPGRRPLQNEESTTTTVTTVTRSAPPRLAVDQNRATRLAPVQSEPPAGASVLRRSTTERRDSGSENSGRSPQAKKARMGADSENDVVPRKESDQDGL